MYGSFFIQYILLLKVYSSNWSCLGEHTGRTVMWYILQSIRALIILLWLPSCLFLTRSCSSPSTRLSDQSREPQPSTDSPVSILIPFLVWIVAHVQPDWGIKHVTFSFSETWHGGKKVKWKYYLQITITHNSQIFFYKLQCWNAGKRKRNLVKQPALNLRRRKFPMPWMPVVFSETCFPPLITEPLQSP